MHDNNGLWADIEAQPANLRNVIDHLLGPERRRLDDAAAMLRNDRPFVLLGMGSAAYLCRPAVAYLQQQGYSAGMMFASDALDEMLPALRQSNVILNTRSGETGELVRLARQLVDERIPFVVITNEPDSTVARLANQIVWVNSHKDQLVSINIVTSMLTATTMLAAAVTHSLDALRSDLDRLPDLLHDVVNRAHEHAAAITNMFEGIRPLYLLGSGAGIGAAECSRLVLEEVARFPAVALDASDFRHGPVEVVDEQFGAFVFVPSGRSAALHQVLGRDIVRNGGRVLYVGAVDDEAIPRSLAFPIRGVSNALLPALQIVPAQLLAYMLAERQGYKPGDVRYISKVIVEVPAG